MAGLLIKDFQFLKKQWSILFLLVGMGVLFAASDRYSNIFMVYSTMIGGLMVINTIAYDSYDNGYAYLFSLPVTPKLYVAEKYLFTVLISAAGCLLSGTMTACMAERGGFILGEHLMTCLVTWMVLLWVACLMIPLNLKFGTEKSRAILLGVWVAVIGIIISLTMHVGDSGELKVHGLLSRIESLGMIGLLAVTGVFTAVVFYLSMAVSTHVMKKKEY